MSKGFGGMAASLDGYIQSATGDLSWPNDSLANDDDYGFQSTVNRTGAYIIGANTYRAMAGMGGSSTPTYILTHDQSLKTSKTTQRYSGDLRKLVERIKSEIPEHKDIAFLAEETL